MRKETINGHKFVFYDDISELPIERFHQYSRYMLVASGIGDSLEDIDRHITKITKLLSVDVKKAHQELLNLRQCLFMVANQRDIHHKGMFFLTKSVDGKPWEDFTDNGIEELFELVNKASIKDIQNALKDVIKNIDNGLRQYFPELFEDSVEKNYTELIRKRALLQIDEIRNGADHTDEIKSLTEQISNGYTPKNFENDKEVIEFDRQFENMCLILSKEFQGGVKGYTVMEFYSAYNLLQEQQKEMRKFNKQKK